MITQTVSAIDFKAQCLEIFNRLARGEINRVVITKRGRPVGVLTPPENEATALAGLHGLMRGTVTIPKGADLIEPVLDESFDAEHGVLHG